MVNDHISELEKKFYFCVLCDAFIGTKSDYVDMFYELPMQAQLESSGLRSCNRKDQDAAKELIPSIIYKIKHTERFETLENSLAQKFVNWLTADN